MRRCGLLLALWAMTLAWSGSARAQAPAPSGPPDVLLLVYQRPGLGDQVDVTYAHTVPHAQAQRDLQALAQTAGWTVAGSKITDAVPPVQQRIGAMTSASFVVAHAIDDSSHTFPLEALITAFRPYKRLTLVFFVASGFQFQGLGQYADNNVRVTMERHGSAYTYQIQVLNPNFERLNLPQPSPADPAGGGRRSPLLLLLSVVAVALAAGAIVYLAAARLGGGGKPPDDHLPTEPQGNKSQDKEPKEKTNAGNP